MADWPIVNNPEQSVVFDFQSVCEVPPQNTSSPIDQYYERSQDLLVRAGNPQLQSDDVLMRLLVVELVSSAELYFRSVLAGAIRVCPLVREVASRCQLALAALDYYPEELLGLGLLESFSLSAEGQLRRQTANVTGFEIKPLSSLGAALSDFEKICHLRHALVHACGELGARNVSELGFSPPNRRRVKLSVSGLQILAAKMHNVVRAYNKFMFDGILRSWIDKQIVVGLWRDDRKRITLLHSLFYSVQDGTGDASPRDMHKKVQAIIAAR